MEPVSDAELGSLVAVANETLRTHGRPCEVSPDQVRGWLSTDTPYPNPPNEEVMRNPYLLIHEIVEIDEVLKMGLRITKDVIVKNLDAVEEAHLRAATVELRVALDLGAFDHVRGRLDDVRAWSEDPTVSEDNKRQYARLYAETKRALESRIATAPQGRETSI